VLTDIVRKGNANIIVLTDRDLGSELMAIPALLATSAVHQHLVRAGLRTRTGWFVVTQAPLVKFTILHC